MLSIPPHRPPSLSAQIPRKPIPKQPINGSQLPPPLRPCAYFVLLSKLRDVSCTVKTPSRPSAHAAGGAEFATSSLWLSAGSSGQPTPGRLVSGLRKLADLDEFLVELAHEMPHELGLKRR